MSVEAGKKDGSEGRFVQGVLRLVQLCSVCSAAGGTIGAAAGAAGLRQLGKPLPERLEHPHRWDWLRRH